MANFTQRCEKNVVSFVSLCLTCQQVKAAHQETVALLQLFPSTWVETDHITMDFVIF